MSGLFDPGLQPERTELAWRRTALAAGVGSLVALRLLPIALGHAAWTLGGLAGVLAAGLLWVLARRRAQTVDQALADRSGRSHLPAAGMLVAVAAATFAIGLLAAAVVAIAAFL